MTKYKFSLSWKEHFNPTTQGFSKEIANTFLSYRDWTTLFLKIISDFFNFLTATGYPVLSHLHNLTSPNAPFPTILTDGKSLIDSLTLYCLNISAYSCNTFFLISYCSCIEIPNICIFRFSFSQYYFFSCYCCNSLEYLCYMKLFAASTFYLVAFDITIYFVLSVLIQILFINFWHLYIIQNLSSFIISIWSWHIHYHIDKAPIVPKKEKKNKK